MKTMQKILYSVLAALSFLVLGWSYRASAKAPGTQDASADADLVNRNLSDGTFTGADATIATGDVQVKITVSGGRIASASAMAPRTNRHSRAINDSAIPQLVSETLNAQSTNIQMVSGATFTSKGYISSLQSALDQAHK